MTVSRNTCIGKAKHMYWEGLYSELVTVELGATEAVQQHLSRNVVAGKPVSQRKLDFEHARSVYFNVRPYSSY